MNYELGRIYRKFIAEEIADVEIKNLPESERAIVDAETRPTTVVVKNQDVRVITLNGKKIIPVDPLYLTKIPGFENDPEPHTTLHEFIFDVKTHPVDRERTGKDSERESNLSNSHFSKLFSYVFEIVRNDRHC